MNRATSIAKGQRIIGAARDEVGAMLKEKYEKGASIRALAASTGRSYGFVHRGVVRGRCDAAQSWR